MSINPEYPAGLLPLYSSGTNSTFFTDCCHTAICNDQRNCPSCGRKVIGWDAENEQEREQVRWNLAYVKPLNKRRK